MMKKLILIMLTVVLTLTLSACGDKTGEMLKNAEIGDIITFGTYEQDNDEENGKEAIEWTVLAKEENIAYFCVKSISNYGNYSTYQGVHV